MSNRNKYTSRNELVRRRSAKSTVRLSEPDKGAKEIIDEWITVVNLFQSVFSE